MQYHRYKARPQNNQREQADGARLLAVPANPPSTAGSVQAAGLNPKLNFSPVMRGLGVILEADWPGRRGQGWARWAGAGTVWAASAEPTLAPRPAGPAGPEGPAPAAPPEEFPRAAVTESHLAGISVHLIRFARLARRGDLIGPSGHFAILPSAWGGASQAREEIRLSRCGGGKNRAPIKL